MVSCLESLSLGAWDREAFKLIGFSTARHNRQLFVKRGSVKPFPDRLFSRNTERDIESRDAGHPEGLRIFFARSLPGSRKEASAAVP
jgi:hypothetical protein